MTERGPIVCATDLGSTGARAVDLAARIAEATGAALSLVHVTGPGPGRTTPTTEAERVLHERLSTRVHASAAALEKERNRAGADARSVLLEGRPWEEILEHARREHASLIVVGPHGQAGPLAVRRGALTEHILGTTADRVVRHARRPVLVGARESAAARQVCGGRWLVAIDFSAASRAALRVAHDLARTCDADIMPFHVVVDVHANPESDDPLRFAAATEDPIANEHAAELALVVKQELGEALDVKVALGRPAEAITLAATELGASMIVMGTRGRTGLAHLLLGSVVERTLRRSAVPVLCVPSR